MKTISTLILTLFVLTSMQAHNEKDSLPGDPTLPSTKKELKELAALDKGEYKYTVEDYFERPKQSSFEFSPKGTYFSYREKAANGKRHVYVKNTETNKVTKAIEEGEELIRGYGWANDDRLVYVKDQGGNENYQLFSVGVDGKDPKSLTPFENVRVGILNGLKEQKDYMIIRMNKDNAQIFEPYKINIVTGELVKLYENKDVSSPISGYDFDKDGNLRAYTKQENATDYVLYYRTSNEAPFERIVKTSWKDNFRIVGFDYTTDYKHDAYVISNLDNNTDELLIYDLKEKKIKKKVYSNETFDVGGVSRSRNRGYEVDYYFYTGEKQVVHPVSETYKKLHEKFTKQFANKQYFITSKTDEEDKYLIYVTSDKLYGTYHLYDAKKDAFKQIFDLMPQLKESDMAEMKPFHFKSRDGLTLYGYVTIPKEAKNGKVPLIVNPHGGP